MPGALSRLQEEEEMGIAGFEEISDPWYLKILEDVPKFPKKYPSWKMEDGNLYKYRMDPLLDPIQNREEKWRLVVPVKYIYIYILFNLEAIPPLPDSISCNNTYLTQF